jgi:hypothetical protein
VASDGAYAMVVGRLKIDSPKPEIQCYVCRAVTNFNDIPHHHLSVIATHIDMVFKLVTKLRNESYILVRSRIIALTYSTFLNFKRKKASTSELLKCGRRT